VNPSNNNSNIKEKRIWDWDKIAQNNTNDDYDSVICIGGETALNQYINRTHQKNIWKYASSLNIKNYFDAACGTGRFLREGFKIADTSAGLDLSWNMLRKAQARTPDALLCQGDLTALPFKSGVFDLSTCVITLKLISKEEDYKRCISELVRVSSRNGKIIIIEDVRKKHINVNGVNLYSTEQIIDFFERAGARLELVSGIRIAYPIRLYKRIATNFLKIILLKQIRKPISQNELINILQKKHRYLNLLYSFGLKCVICFNAVLDNLFAKNILNKWATEKIFIFTTY